MLTHAAHTHFRFVTVDNEREDGSTVLDVEVKDYPGKGNGMRRGVLCVRGHGISDAWRQALD